MPESPFTYMTWFGVWLVEKKGKPLSSLFKKALFLQFTGIILVIIGISGALPWATIESTHGTTTMDLSGYKQESNGVTTEKDWSEAEDGEWTTKVCGKHSNWMLALGIVAVIKSALIGLYSIPDVGAADRGEYQYNAIPKLFDVPVFSCMAGALPFVCAYLWNAGCAETMLSITNLGKADSHADFATMKMGGGVIMCKIGGVLMMIGGANMMMQANRTACLLDEKKKESSDAQARKEGIV